jgi:hypothetical protein
MSETDNRTEARVRDRVVDMLERRLQSMEDKIDRLIADSANARHSERLKAVEANTQLAHERVSNLKQWAFSAILKAAGVMLAIIGAMAAVVWKWIESGIRR